MTLLALTVDSDELSASGEVPWTGGAGNALLQQRILADGPA